ncbi:MAG: hypothetical protein FJ090_14270 [Deltaproteobacteria bacterium]|nr:hypothetical protein [Deltaproteobacteria bacterium]
MAGLLLLALVALAQDAPGASPPAGAPARLVPLLEAPFHSTEGWVEERGTSSFQSRLVSMSRAADGGAWLLLLEDGTLLRSLDGARSWSRVLRGVEAPDLDEEHLLLEGESYAGEAADEAAETSTEGFDDSSDSEDYSDDSQSSEGEAAPAEAPSEASTGGEAAIDAQDIDALVDRDAALDSMGLAVWFHPDDPSIALAGRGDGLWRSVDGGVRWALVDADASATCFLAMPGGVILAGTARGLRTSPDNGGRWIDAVDATDGARVYALDSRWGRVFAASDKGLFTSEDALRWRRLGAADPAYAVLSDPGWEGGFWVTTGAGLLRSDDMGQSFLRMGRQSMLALRGLSALSGQGRVLAWGDDGVWESIDGGVTWHALAYGLRDPHVRAVVVVDGRPVVATSTGVWRLQPVRLGARITPEPVAPAVEASAEDQLATLVRVATTRRGLDLETLHGLRWRPFLPTVQLAAGAWQGLSRDSAYLTGQTDQDEQLGWSFTAKLCFGGCVSLLGSVAEVEDDYSDYAEAAAYDGEESAEAREDATGEAADDLYVIGDEVYGENAEPLAAANVAQKVRNYRFSVADQVVSAWTAIRRLTDAGPPGSLGGSVDHMLQLAELSARLDLYTDGAYSRATIPESP